MGTALFTVAKRQKLKMRIAVAGPSGSGKTLGALRLAYGLCEDWAKVFVIDTENGSALAYAQDPQQTIGEFMHAPLAAPYTPKRYIEMIKAAAEADASVIVIDSLTHEWAGAGGMLEQHDAMGGNSFTNWKKVNPAHQDLIDLIVNQVPCHVIATLRSKTAYSVTDEEDNGRKSTKVARLGMAPIMRPGTEYEFMLYVELDRQTHNADVITKRGSMLPDMSAIELTESLGRKLRAWAESGEVPPPVVQTDQQLWVSFCKEHSFGATDIEKALGTRSVAGWMKERNATIKDAMNTLLNWAVAESDKTRQAAGK